MIEGRRGDKPRIAAGKPLTDFKNNYIFVVTIIV
jgi:hypothetical protein